MELSTVCQRCSSVENQQLIAAAPDLLEACLAVMRYWWWCTPSADTPGLQSLCNEAVELIAKAVQDAGVTVLDGLPIKPDDSLVEPLSDEKLEQLRPIVANGLKQAVDDGALEAPK